ncbi:MAG: MarR family transcriptional regulator [Actinomycetota bacterium]|nr:MarR family transcriptional regulator [Actinomycetota bacterium]
MSSDLTAVAQTAPTADPGRRAVGIPGARTSGDKTSEQTADIADALITVIRFYGNIRSRLANAADPELVPIFLLIQLVKDGPKRAKDLADTMCADQSTVSRQVAFLVKSGLIERRADPDDGRASLLVPTAFGVERVREYLRDRGHAVEPVIADWSSAERSDFLRLLQRYAIDLEGRRDEVQETMTRRHGQVRLEPAHDTSQPHTSIERFN